MKNRRTRERYPLQLPVEYLTRDGSRGKGVIVDISSQSARVVLDRSHAVLTEMRLDIAWPVKLNNSTPLRLRINARVERVDRGHTVLLFKGYEFVTAAQPNAALGGVGT